MKRLRFRAGQYLLGFLLFLAVWWGGSLWAGPAVLPAPGAVAAYVLSPGVAGEFFRQVGLTAARGLLGFSSAWMAALPLGFLMGRREAGERIGFLPVFLLQSAPPLFWVTPLVLWLGTKGAVAPVVAFLVSFPLLTVHAMNAVKAIPDRDYDVFAVYAPRKSVVIRELYIPHLLPAMKSNIHLGLLVAVKAAMLAEWFAAQDGFGRTIRLHYQFFAMTEFLAWALMFLLVVGGLSLLLKWVMERFLPAQRSTPVPAHGTAGAEEGDHRKSQAPPGPYHRPRPKPFRSAPRCLIAENLTYGYRRRPLFENLNLRVEADEPLVIHGESGCGKTSLLKCLAGLALPWAGRVDAGESVGLVFQDDALLNHRDALGNVLLPSFPRYGSVEIRRAMEALEQWGLSASASLFPHQLSGGMRKRLAMAREWYRVSSVLLLDEPFVNLDREARQALWEALFAHLEERRLPTVIVTHYPEEIADYPARTLNWGELISS